MNSAVIELIGRLSRYAYARDRETEREPRTITITDDEAILILDVFDHFALITGDDE